MVAKLLTIVLRHQSLYFGYIDVSQAVEESNVYEECHVGNEICLVLLY